MSRSPNRTADKYRGKGKNKTLPQPVREAVMTVPAVETAVEMAVAAPAATETSLQVQAPAAVVRTFKSTNDFLAHANREKKANGGGNLSKSEKKALAAQYEQAMAQQALDAEYYTEPAVQPDEPVALEEYWVEDEERLMPLLLDEDNVEDAVMVEEAQEEPAETPVQESKQRRWNLPPVAKKIAAGLLFLASIGGAAFATFHKSQSKPVAQKSAPAEKIVTARQTTPAVTRADTLRPEIAPAPAPAPVVARTVQAPADMEDDFEEDIIVKPAPVVETQEDVADISATMGLKANYAEFFSADNPHQTMAQFIDNQKPLFGVSSAAQAQDVTWHSTSTAGSKVTLKYN